MVDPKLKLVGGSVYDPTNGIDGQPMTLWLDQGKVVSQPESEEGFRSIDVAGRIIMPGGIDMHSHVAGPKVNIARMMQPEISNPNGVESTQRGDVWFHSGAVGNVPTIITTGYKYAGLGYTTCFDAAISPMAAKLAHFDLKQLPNVDSGFFTLVGNNHYALRCIQKKDPKGLESFLGWLMNRVGSYAPKIVNPGGVENWKHARSATPTDLDTKVNGFGVSARQLLHDVTQAANQIGLPHPVHIHTNNLGVPGNWTTTRDTLNTISGFQAHLAHIQFHSYGGGDENESSLCSKVEPLAAIINENPNLSVDVGQIMFGRTTSMTGDGPLGHYLHQVSGEKWYSGDTELESGCGISPIEYKNKNFINALQWAIGLEWYLLVKNPWQIAMSTDHPNGASFFAYPQIVRLLMDREFRNARLAEVNPKVLKHSQLADLDREYSLNEIAIITRASPAKLLGLKNKGHLGVGADADVCVYTPNKNYETMFAMPWMVLKGGHVLLRDSELCSQIQGRILVSNPGYDQDRNTEIESWFERNYSIPVEQYGI